MENDPLFLFDTDGEREDDPLVGPGPGDSQPVCVPVRHQTPIIPRDGLSPISLGFRPPAERVANGSLDHFGLAGIWGILGR